MSRGSHEQQRRVRTASSVAPPTIFAMHYIPFFGRIGLAHIFPIPNNRSGECAPLSMEGKHGSSRFIARET